MGTEEPRGSSERRVRALHGQWGG